MSQVSQFLKDLAKHSDAVKKATRPLRHLGVTCFYYLSVKNNGDHVLLTDCPEVDDYYYDEKLYVKDPYLRHPDNYQSGFLHFETDHKQEYDASLAYIIQKFKIAPLLGLCQKQQDSVDFFGFWGEADRAPYVVPSQYTHLLKAFAPHFKKECKSLLQPDVGPFLSLRKLLGAEVFDNVATQERKEEAKLFRQYLIEIGFKDKVVKADSLSQREKECLQLLLRGKAMKETASILHLSPRTVEHYIDSARDKLGCRYKNELFALAEEFVNLGLI